MLMMVLKDWGDGDERIRINDLTMNEQAMWDHKLDGKTRGMGDLES